MPAPLTVPHGNELFDTVIAATLTPPASIVTTALTAGTYTVQGLVVGDICTISILGPVTTYSITSMYVSAANTLVVYFSSETGSTVSSAAAINVLINVVRLENYAQGFASLPTSIQ